MTCIYNGTAKLISRKCWLSYGETADEITFDKVYLIWCLLKLMGHPLGLALNFTFEGTF